MTTAPSRATLSNRTPAPFAKIPGGKRKLVPELLKRLPKSFGTYFEPFVGGGALFFALQPKRAVLGDDNECLITTYRAIRDDVEALIADLQHSWWKNDEDRYYTIRAKAFQNGDLRTATEFLYLNRCCFNGVWRVNKDGGFNVPFGRYTNPTICDADNLRVCSQALTNADMWAADFEVALSSVKAGDVAYLDPPYWPVSKTADFTAYTANGFDAADQTRLRDIAFKLKQRGVFVMLSNADVPPVRELYKRFKIERVEMPRSINSNASKRGNVGELIIT